MWDKVNAMFGREQRSDSEAHEPPAEPLEEAGVEDAAVSEEPAYIPPDDPGAYYAPCAEETPVEPSPESEAEYQAWQQAQADYASEPVALESEPQHVTPSEFAAAPAFGLPAGPQAFRPEVFEEIEDRQPRAPVPAIPVRPATRRVDVAPRQGPGQGGLRPASGSLRPASGALRPGMGSRPPSGPMRSNAGLRPPSGPLRANGPGSRVRPPSGTLMPAGGFDDLLRTQSLKPVAQRKTYQLGDFLPPPILVDAIYRAGLTGRLVDKLLGGWIAFQGGRVVAASANGMKGLEAACAVLNSDRYVLLFDRDDDARFEVQIDLTTDKVIMEATKAKDEGAESNAGKCGLDEPPKKGPYLTVLFGASTKHYPLHAAGVVIVGRALDCDIVLDHPSVSRRHAQITLLNGVPEVEDLGSNNGTVCDGVKIAAPRRLRPHQRFLMGELMVCYHPGWNPDLSM